VSNYYSQWVDKSKTRGGTQVKKGAKNGKFQIRRGSEEKKRPTRLSGFGGGKKTRESHKNKKNIVEERRSGELGGEVRRKQFNILKPVCRQGPQGGCKARQGGEGWGSGQEGMGEAPKRWSLRSERVRELATQNRKKIKTCL